MNSLTYRDQIRQAKGLLELKLESGVKGNKRDFYKCKRKTRETVGPTAQGARDLVTKDMEKASMPSSRWLFFSSAPRPSRSLRLIAWCEEMKHYLQ